MKEFDFGYSNKKMKKIENYAPIVIFAYNRADKLKKLLECLEKNKFTNEMDLYIFVDIPDKKNKKYTKYNSEVLEFLKYYEIHCTNFKKINIEVADYHKGLADSVIYGVSKVINQYGKIIVLEDDLEVSNDFLDYMQRGLIFYEHDKKIWSLAAHCPKCKFLSTYEKDIFLAPRASSLGWGTWKNRWDNVDWGVTSYEKFRKDVVGRMIFNLGGNDLYRMLKGQMTDEKYDSWAIRWCYQEFLERKYTVYPKETRVIHCGNDNRSTHSTYRSTQNIKKRYKKCCFEILNPNIKVIWQFKKIHDIPLRGRIEEFLNKCRG